jgi:hypothetical protein
MYLLIITQYAALIMGSRISIPADGTRHSCLLAGSICFTFPVYLGPKRRIGFAVVGALCPDCQHIIYFFASSQHALKLEGPEGERGEQIMIAIS